jgi:hypothetical protein
MHWGVAQFTDGDSYDYTGPDWFLGATKFNGAWVSNSWDVAVTETNAASLNLYLDRVLLTNAVRMAVTLMDRPGAGLEVDLLNTNGTAVATNLVGNLLAGGGTELRRKVMVDLPAFPDGVFISLRRSAGHVTVFDTVLYVDDDDDGLDKDQEAQLGTSDLLTDSDLDGYSDVFELAAATDPASASSVPTAPVLITVPADTFIACNATPDPAVTGSATAIADCSSAPVFTHTDAPGTSPQGPVVLRTWTATACGYTNSAVQTIHLHDSTVPVIAAPSAATLLASDLNLAPGPVSGRYVRVSLTSGQPLSLAELQVLSGAVNVAITGTATQSSTDSGGVASRAIDGNTNGNWAGASVTHTGTGGAQWWQVDLGSAKAIDLIRVWNRTDCCGERLAGYTVEILDSAGKRVWADRNNSIPRNARTHLVTREGLPVRYVRVSIPGTGKIVSLAEVEVISDGVNLAPIGSATQSTTDSGGVASRAIDGNTSGTWSQGSVTHTTSSTNPWWELDLGGVHGVRQVRIWNRTDCCDTRLDGYQVTFYDADHQTLRTLGPFTRPTGGAANAHAATIGAATATDNCDSSPVITRTDSAPVNGIVTRTWTATDDSGNVSTATQLLTLTDDVAPVITAPVDNTVPACAAIPPAVTGQPTVSDNIDPSPAVTWFDTAYPLSSSRKAAYPFDEAPFASLTRSHDGLLSGLLQQGARSGVAGRSGNAIALDGADDYVDLGTGPSIGGAGDFTVSAWVKSTDANGGFVLSQRDGDADGYQGGYYLGLNASGLPFFQIYSWYYSDNRVASGTVAVNDGQWHHLLGIRRSNQSIEIFVDGVSAGTGTAFGYGLNAATSTTVGANKRDNNNFLAGVVDDIAIWTRALAAREVTALHQRGGQGRGAASLVSQVQRTFTATDASGNAASSAPQWITTADDSAPVLTVPADATPGPADGLHPDQTGHATALDLCDPTPALTWSDSTDLLSGGLRAHYTLNETGSTLADTSGADLHGTAVALGASSPGAVGSAREFNGTSSHVTLGSPAALNFAGPITVSAWIHPQANDGCRNIVAHGYRLTPNGELFLRINAGKYQVGSWNGADYVAQANMPAGDLNTWVLLTGVYDGAAWRLYRNGELLASTTAGTGAISFDAPWAIGARGTGTERFFKGWIDAVAIWSRGLSAAEVKTLHDLGRQCGTLLAAPADSNVLTVKRTWTAADDAGNSASGLQTLTLSGLSTDSDNDGLDARAELLAGTNPAVADTDGDGLSDGAEVNTHHANPLSGDTDGDGLDDLWEITWGQNPLSNDAFSDDDGDHLGSWIEYYGLNPSVREDIQVSTARAATHSATGAVWTAVGDSMRLVDPRGWIEFLVVLPDPDLYVFVIHGRAAVSSAASETFQLQVSLDGAPIGTHSLTSVDGQPGWVSGIIPWTAPGTYTLRIFVDNHSSHRAFQLDQIDILRIDDTDDNTNGLKDWIDNRFDQKNLVHPPAPQVFVSPLCLEGVVEYLGRMTVSVGTNAVAVLPGVDDGWYANVPLLTEGATPIDVAFEDGGRVVTQSVEWVALNAMTVSNLVLRVNDTLRFTAFTGEEPATNAVLTVTLPNGATTNLAAGAEIDWPFPETGTRTLRVIESLDGLSTTNVVQIAVKSATFGAPIAVHVGKSRAWTLGSVPVDLPVTADLDLSFLRDPLLLTRTYNVTTPAAGSHYVIARTDDGGPVLAHGRVDAFLIASSSDTRVETIGFYADGSRLVEMDVIAGTLPAGVEVRLEIFVAGVTFDDGTTLKILGPSDFDEFGVAKVRFIKPAWTITSVCHRMHFYQNGVYLGTR